MLVSIATLLFTFGDMKTGSLTQMTKPYLGTYECQRAYYGSADVLESFSHIKLELKDKENYVLSFCEKDGRKQERTGKYVYDEKSKTLTLYAEKGIKRAFPLENGVLTVDVPILGKTLYLQFKQN